jgi:hypothetical protein
VNDEEFNQAVSQYNAKLDELQNLDRQIAALKAVQEKRDALVKDMGELRAVMSGRKPAPKPTV